MQNPVQEEPDSVGARYRSVDQKKNEIFVVVEADTIVHPRTMVVHFEGASLRTAASQSHDLRIHVLSLRLKKPITPQ